MNIETILSSLTDNDANEWLLNEDKYVFCLDVMGMSADDRNADHMVELMESHFKKLLPAKLNEKHSILSAE